ncbi:MAG: hypothetical protein U9R25_18825 [Chloroflexota bacterium]|nr:hypothetical protein [Chloroflexota bacterium]
MTLGQLLFFSAFEGDARVLDPENNLALKLADRGGQLPYQTYQIIEMETTFAVEWNAQYALTGSGFTVMDREGKVTLFPTYPLQQIQDGERQTRRRIREPSYRRSPSGRPGDISRLVARIDASFSSSWLWPLSFLPRFVSLAPLRIGEELSFCTSINDRAKNARPGTGFPLTRADDPK